MAAASDVGHLPDEAAALSARALLVLQKLKRRNLTIATAESCTGGLLASLLTDQEGFGRCFDRAFITYTDKSKSEMLGTERIYIKRNGAVSAEIARAMALGAIDRSEADIAVSVTGFAGPAGSRDETGLVYLVCATRLGTITVRECHFGEISRERVRNQTVSAALELIEAAVNPD